LSTEGNVTFAATLSTDVLLTFASRAGTLAEVEDADAVQRKSTASVPESLQEALRPGATLYRSAVLRRPVTLIGNSRGQAAFAADVTPLGSVGTQAGVYSWNDGRIEPVVSPGDALPGGGIALTASLVPGNVGLNEAGDVAFTATLRSESHGAYDTGLYVWHAGRVSLVARSGSEIADIGRIERIQASLVGRWEATGGACLNDAGEIAFAAILADHRVAILVATPVADEAKRETDAVPARLALDPGRAVHGVLRVRFGLPHASPVLLRLYSVDGRRVANVTSGDMPAGRHEASLDTHAIAPGIYFLRLQAQGETVTRRVLIAT